MYVEERRTRHSFNCFVIIKNRHGNEQRHAVSFQSSGKKINLNFISFSFRFVGYKKKCCCCKSNKEVYLLRLSALTYSTAGTDAVAVLGRLPAELITRESGFPALLLPPTRLYMAVCECV